ncbi:hypothetical protein CGLO_14244 [Colletotrichum gloeosporioides Cg-14]|uniref:Uncharacterized protein n=1 Tax=Colletotrichum gloeosporioides (strain Cg-14) TaxID=1237896 RepID=T0K4B2_COLGC|nr:hypothetical protein CGLO_14244 [Colletotrichum gloeosporioides Cg-14]
MVTTDIVWAASHLHL